MPEDMLDVKCLYVALSSLSPQNAKNKITHVIRVIVV